jgi:hypothetical protein
MGSLDLQTSRTIQLQTPLTTVKRVVPGSLSGTRWAVLQTQLARIRRIAPRDVFWQLNLRYMAGKSAV